MVEVIRLCFVLAIIASFVSFETSGSYLSALQKRAIDRPQTAPSPRNSYPHNGGRNNGSRKRGSCSTDYKLDYLMLTLQWGPGFCATSPQHCKRRENKLFTIHGMWPQLRNAESPAFCCFDNTFDYYMIKPLVDALNKYWFSYYDNDSRNFWSHEWLKHGTCLRDVKQLQGEQLFFGNTLKIVQQLPILETLTKAGIVPGDKRVYNSLDIQNTLRQLTGGMRARVDCDLEAHQPIPIMKGVDFCFDTDLKFIDCPPSKSRCQRQVLFLN